MKRGIFSLLAVLALLAPAGCEKQKSGSVDASPGNSAAAPAAPDGGLVDQGKPRSVEIPSNLEGPHWWCDQEVYDFGEVWAGTVVKFPFSIKSVGNETLKILEAKAQCSCTVSEDYTKEIAPGREGTMPIRMLTVGKRGFVSEKMKIKTNDPTHPEIEFELRGMVNNPFELELTSDLEASKSLDPKAALEEIKKKGPTMFGAIKADQRLQRVIKIRNTSGKPVAMKYVGLLPRDSRFSAQFQEVVPQEEFVVTINGDPPFPPGTTSATVVLETNLVGLPTYNLTMYAKVPPRVECTPGRIVVDPRMPVVGVRKIYLNNHGESSWDVKAVSVSDPAYRFELLPGTDAKKHILQVTLPGPGYSCPEYGELIRIETTDAEVPILEVPIVPSRERPAAPRPADKPLTMHPVTLGAAKP